MEEQPVSPKQPSSMSEKVIIQRNNNIPLIAAIIFLGLVTAGAAIYLGNQKENGTNSEVVSQASTPTQTNKTPTVVPTQAEELNWESYVSEKMKDLSFPGYSLSYPFEWSQKETRNELTTTLTLTKGGNEIKIYQAPTGGSQCVFEGEMPEGPANDYRKSEYVDVKAEAITLRRVLPSQKAGKITYSFCSNSKASPSSFGVPTVFGSITYTQNTKDEVSLSEMDKILSTLKSL